MEFILRFVVKAALYFLLLLAVMALGLLPAATLTLFWAALILAAVNTVLRPFFVLIALPFNIITLGIASVFANLLSLVIALAIIGVSGGFWVLLLVALIIMLADDGVRLMRRSIRIKKA